MARHVIIGNGIAGINAAETIRFLRPEDEITIIAAEAFPPYSRPMISLLLEGRIEADRLIIRGPNFYRKNRIDIKAGEKVVHIDPDNRRVVTDRDANIVYDKLLIASGADPRSINVDGRSLENVSCLRTVDHAQKMVNGLASFNRALVLGGGLVGFKAAYSLMKQGIKVTLVIKSGYPLSMQVDAVAGRMIQDELESNGLSVVTGVDVTALEGNGSVRRAHFSDGASMDCELVVVGKGVSPAVDFVPRDKITVDTGIVVDDTLETSAQGIYAVGDVAQAMDVVRKQTWVNAIWPVAVEQGIVAGHNMAGRKVSYRGSMGRNVMRVFGLDVMSGGIVNPDDGENYEVLTDYNPARKFYRRIVLRDNIPCGAAIIGSVEQGGVILSMIQRGLPLTEDPGKLLNKGFGCSTFIGGSLSDRRLTS